MPVILENTRFDPLKKFKGAVGAEGLPVNKVWFTATHSNTIFVQLLGIRDRDFTEGVKVKVITPTIQFTGAIYYTYQGATAYNLYIKPDLPTKAESVPTATSGTIWLASAATNAGSSDVPVVVTNPIITVDPAIDPTVTPIEDEKTDPVTNVTTTKKSKTLLYVGAVLVLVVGVLAYFKLKKGKKG